MSDDFSSNLLLNDYKNLRKLSIEDIHPEEFKKLYEEVEQLSSL
jgi:hypothetical protein